MQLLPSAMTELDPPESSQANHLGGHLEQAPDQGFLRPYLDDPYKFHTQQSPFSASRLN
jgi:hypothetical protein